MSGSEIKHNQGPVPQRSALICVIAFQLALVVSVLTYLVHRDPPMVILAGGAAFVAAFVRLNELIG